MYVTRAAFNRISPNCQSNTKPSEVNVNFNGVINTLKWSSLQLATLIFRQNKGFGTSRNHENDDDQKCRTPHFVVQKRHKKYLHTSLTWNWLRNQSMKIVLYLCHVQKIKKDAKHRLVRNGQTAFGYLISRTANSLVKLTITLQFWNFISGW